MFSVLLDMSLKNNKWWGDYFLSSHSLLGEIPKLDSPTGLLIAVYSYSDWLGDNRKITTHKGVFNIHAFSCSRRKAMNEFSCETYLDFLKL